MQSTSYFKTLISPPPRLSPLSRLRARRQRAQKRRNQRVAFYTEEAKKNSSVPTIPKTAPPVGGHNVLGLGPRTLPTFELRAFFKTKLRGTDIVPNWDHVKPSPGVKELHTRDQIAFIPDERGANCEAFIVDRPISVQHVRVIGEKLTVGLGLGILPPFRYEAVTMKPISLDAPPIATHKIKIVLQPPEVVLLFDNVESRNVEMFQCGQVQVTDHNYLHPIWHIRSEPQWSLLLPEHEQEVLGHDDELRPASPELDAMDSDDSGLDPLWLSKAEEEWAELSMDLEDTMDEQLGFCPTNGLNDWDTDGPNSGTGCSTPEFTWSSTSEVDEVAEDSEDDEDDEEARGERAIAALDDVHELLAQEKAMGWVMGTGPWGTGTPPRLIGIC